jgi:hypothetical protein
VLFPTFFNCFFKEKNLLFATVQFPSLKYNELIFPKFSENTNSSPTFLWDKGFSLNFHRYISLWFVKENSNNRYPKDWKDLQFDLEFEEVFIMLFICLPSFYESRNVCILNKEWRVKKWRTIH